MTSWASHHVSKTAKSYPLQSSPPSDKMLSLRRMAKRLVLASAATYNQLRYGDVFQNWDQLMRLSHITDSNEGDPAARSRKVAINVILAVWLLFCALRISLSQFLMGENGMDHILGHTLCNTGNVYKTIAAMAGFGLVMCASYRLVCIRMTLNDEMIFMRILKHIAYTGGLQTSKVKMIRLVHWVTLAASTFFVICALCCMSGMLYVNVQSSNSAFEIGCWIIWYVQDISFGFIASDAILFPAIWILTAVNYRMDVRMLCQKVLEVTQLNTAGVKREGSARLKEIHRLYNRLTEDAVLVNKMLAPILFVLTLSAIPVACTSLFIAVYADNVFFGVTAPAAGGTFTLAACALLALAADITSQSENLHSLLSIVVNRQSIASCLSQEQRRLLLDMMENVSSENHSLALMTMDGQKFTSQSFAVFLMETAIQYTLLISFNRDIAFT